MNMKAVEPEDHTVSAKRTMQVSYLCYQSFVNCFLGTGIRWGCFWHVASFGCCSAPCHAIVIPSLFPEFLLEWCSSCFAVPWQCFPQLPYHWQREFIFEHARERYFLTIAFLLWKINLSGFKMNFCASLKSLLSKLWEPGVCVSYMYEYLFLHSSSNCLEFEGVLFGKVSLLGPALCSAFG